MPAGFPKNPKKHKRPEGAPRRYDPVAKKQEREKGKEIKEEMNVFKRMEQYATPGYSFAAIGSNLQPGFVNKQLNQQKIQRDIELNEEIVKTLLDPNTDQDKLYNRVVGGKRRKSVKRKNKSGKRKNKSGRKRTVKKNKAKGKKTRKN